MGIGVIMPKWLFYLIVAVVAYVVVTKFGLLSKLKSVAS